MTDQGKTQKIQLDGPVRQILGKKVKKLRTEGFVPANIYGPGFKSLAITVNTRDFQKAYKTAKETGIIYIQTKTGEIPTLIKGVQKHPVKSTLLHIDFRKVDLQQKIETSVPIKVIGESEAVVQKGGVLLTQNDHILIEALPADIPSEIEIDISGLKEIGLEIKIQDLPKSTKFAIKDEPEKVILSVIAHKEESLTPETQAEEPEVITAKEGEEGEVVTEEAPTEEKKEPKGEKKEEEQKENKE